MGTLPPSEVLLAPRFPRFDDETIKEHKEYLQQAVPLRKAGKSDWEIEAVLTQLMDEDRQRKREEGGVDAGEQSHTPITLDEIRQFLQREEESQANKKTANFTTIEPHAAWVAQGPPAFAFFSIATNGVGP